MVVDMTHSTCITCGCAYAIPTTMWNAQRQSGGYHHCPNGHPQGWSKDGCENAQLRRERDRLKQQAAQKDDEIREAQAAAEKARKEIARVKRRHAAGTCPCCKRTFTNMANHMRTKHPDYKPTLECVA